LVRTLPGRIAHRGSHFLRIDWIYDLLGRGLLKWWPLLGLQCVGSDAGCRPVANWLLVRGSNK
jgi:hypothetical protein